MTMHGVILLFMEVLLAISCTKRPAENVMFEASKVSVATSMDNERKILFEETFENNQPFAHARGMEVGDWAFALQFVQKPVYRGTKAARFEIRKDQPLVKDGKRAEITIVGPATNKNRWYSFTVYFPADDFAKDSEREIISQWYQRSDRHLGEKSASPATALRIKKDRFFLDTGYNDDLISAGVKSESKKKIDLGPVTKNTWHEFVFHFIHSYQEDGLIEIWHNGVKVLAHTGGNMYNNASMPKWKIGVYKAAFKTGTSDVYKRVVYFDNIKVGNQMATLADMVPSAELEIK